MFDAVSYAMGAEKGKGNVELYTDAYTFSDDGEGNITITAAANTAEEETNNG